MTPVLIACAHGTRSPEGRATIDEIIAGLARSLPDTVVEPAYVDVHGPYVSDVTAALGGRDAVIVPLLLSTGHHTEVDIRRAASHASDRIRVAPPLGPHPALADLLVDRAVQAGARHGDTLVLGAAGSSHAKARDDVDAMTALVQERWQGHVAAGYGSAMSPRIDEAVTAERARTTARVVGVPYVLAPGFFASVVQRAGADLTAMPLGADDRVIAVARARYRAVSPVSVGSSDSMSG